MENIHINLEELEARLEQFRSLKKNYAEDTCIPPAVSGGGKTIEEIEMLGQLYQRIHTEIMNLFTNTISFLENVKNSYRTSDEKAAKKIGDR